MAAGALANMVPTGNLLTLAFPVHIALSTVVFSDSTRMAFQLCLQYPIIFKFRVANFIIFLQNQQGHSCSLQKYPTPITNLCIIYFSVAMIKYYDQDY